MNFARANRTKSLVLGSTRMNHLFLGFIMSVTAPIVAQQTTIPADSKWQKTLKTVSNGFIMIVSESMLNPKNK